MLAVDVLKDMALSSVLELSVYSVEIGAGIHHFLGGVFNFNLVNHYCY